MERLTYLLIASATALTGCRSDHLYCPGAPLDNCNLRVDALPSCSSDTQCSSPLAVCDLGASTCVQCTTAKAGACSGTTPACVNDMCQACTAHSQCASGACLPDGTCGDDTNVAYVAPGSSENTLCTKKMPCLIPSEALSTGRPFVKFTGATIESMVIIQDRDVTFLADPGAKLTSHSSDLIVQVQGKSHVIIYDLEITGALGATGFGISLPAGNSAQLELHRAKVTNNGATGISATGGVILVSESTISDNVGGGISASGATLTVSQSTISDSTGGGISASGGTLTVSQSIVSGNIGGGISVMGAGAFDIENNFIIYNGSAQAPTESTVGGVAITANTGGSKFVWNTVAFNRSSGLSLRGGVSCNAPLVTASGNLIFHNSEDDGAGGVKTDATTQINTTGACQYGNTLSVDIDPASLGFKQPVATPYDFHLTSMSPSTVVNAGGNCSGIDIDGDQRPLGPACDLGADEYKPEQ